MKEIGRMYEIQDLLLSTGREREQLIRTLFREGYTIRGYAVQDGTVVVTFQPSVRHIEKYGSTGFIGYIDDAWVTAYLDTKEGRTLDKLLRKWTAEKKG